MYRVSMVLLLVGVSVGCPRPAATAPPGVSDDRPLRPQCATDPPPTKWAAGSPEEEAAHARRRKRMVAADLRGRDITHPRVLEAMSTVPRHRFVAPSLRAMAYADRPLPAGCRQTISQPYIVALTTQLLNPGPGARVLDVGTGTGYQAAVLAPLVASVKSIEIVCPLAKTARARLRDLGVKNVQIRCGDGFVGWPEGGPYDGIVVAAAPTRIPPALLEQLAPGGRLVIPVGGETQELVVVQKTRDGKLERKSVLPVRFVPMTR